VLILFVLLQPGKSDAAAVFGGGASSTAFGPRGTQTVMAKVTVGAAISFFLIAFLFSIPGLIGKKSLGRSLSPQSQGQAPAPFTPSNSGDESAPGAAPQATPQGGPPAGATPSAPAASPSPPGSPAPSKTPTGGAAAGTAPAAQPGATPAKK